MHSQIHILHTKSPCIICVPENLIAWELGSQWVFLSRKATWSGSRYQAVTEGEARVCEAEVPIRRLSWEHVWVWDALLWRIKKRSQSGAVEAWGEKAERAGGESFRDFVLFLRWDLDSIFGRKPCSSSTQQMVLPWSCPRDCPLHILGALSPECPSLHGKLMGLI
jgi:hypothetical protein